MINDKITGGRNNQINSTQVNAHDKNLQLVINNINKYDGGNGIYLKTFVNSVMVKPAEWESLADATGHNVWSDDSEISGIVASSIAEGNYLKALYLLEKAAYLENSLARRRDIGKLGFDLGFYMLENNLMEGKQDLILYSRLKRYAFFEDMKGC